jgi:hypothetical protein
VNGSKLPPPSPSRHSATTVRGVTPPPRSSRSSSPMSSREVSIGSATLRLRTK